MSSTSLTMGRPWSRIESLSDLIFGLALSIGALNLVSSGPLTGPNPLGSLLNGIVLFAFSFMILIGVWLRYTDIMTVLPVETRRSRDLSIVLLLLVALELYLFNQLFAYGSFGSGTSPLTHGSYFDVSTTLWALDIGAIYGILALFTSLLVKEEKKRVAPELLADYRRDRKLELVAAGGFLPLSLPRLLDRCPSVGSPALLLLDQPLSHSSWSMASRTNKGQVLNVAGLSAEQS